jgi:hypothetical protein
MPVLPWAKWSPGWLSPSARCVSCSNARSLGWHAYTLSVRGNLLSLAGNIGAAEAGFEQAIAVARAQGARGYELRAANGLGQVWQQTGRGAQVRGLIESLLTHFAPGFSTPDLDEARALLKVVQRRA